MSFPLTVDIRVDNSDSAALAVHDIVTQLEAELERRKIEHDRLTKAVQYGKEALFDLAEEHFAFYLRKISSALGAFKRKHARIGDETISSDQLERTHLRFGVSNVAIEYLGVEVSFAPLLFIDSVWRPCRAMVFEEIEIREKPTRRLLFADNPRVETAAQAVRDAEAAASMHWRAEIVPLAAHIRDRARIEQTVRAELTRKLLGHEAARALGHSLSAITASLTARLLEEAPRE